MDLILSVKSDKQPGPNLSIDCPRCGARGTGASCYEQRDRLYLFFVIPTFGLTNTFVTCQACGALLRSTMPLEQLAANQQNSSIIRQFLAPDTSIVIKLLAILSVTLFCVPVLGVILSLISTAASWKTGGWTKTCSVVGLILSSVLSIGMILVLALKAQ